MAIQLSTQPILAQKVFDLVQILSPADQHWLAEQLDRLLDDEEKAETAAWDDDEALPESATLNEAIELYLADKCSLGRAAELAGVTRWDIQEILYQRGTPVVIETYMTAEEMDELAEELEQEGLLC